MAYKKANQKIIHDHRNVLEDMLPDLTWEDGEPDGYSVDRNRNVRKVGFRSY